MRSSVSRGLRARASAIALCLLFTFAGCNVDDLRTRDRMDHGLVIILPGIEGPSVWNMELARGLDEGGVRGGIEIFDWGTEIPGGMLINLADYERNRSMARTLHDRVVDYRRDHPRQPVHLVGHSGGAGLAVMAAEMLPARMRISSIVLLAAALSPNYDLCAAMRHTKYGIFNYYSELDLIFLGAGTTAAGTIDRSFGPAAGATGFEEPSGLDPAAKAEYRRLLHQVKWDPEMRFSSHFGGHMDWTHRPFVKQYLGPLIVGLSH